MKRVCISLAAALALAVPSLAQVAQIGDTTYADFNSFFTAFQAIAASETPTTVTLLDDLTGDLAVPGTVPVKEGQAIVFDLNGRTMETALQREGRHYYAIDNYGTLTIKDSSAGQTGTIRARGVQNLGNGKLTIESGTIVSVDANGGACIWNEADVTVKGGTFTTEFEGTPSDKFGPGCLNNSGTALVTGGTFHNVNRRTYAIISNTGSIEITPAEDSEVTVFGAHGGLAVDGGTAVVNGGSYSSSDYYGLYVSNDGLGADPMQAAVTVNDGTFDGKSYSVWVGSDYNDPVNSTIAIKGGTFLKPLHRQDVSRPDAIQVSGGTFSEKPDNAWFADGFIPVENADGTFGVAPGSFAAEIDGVKYLTLQEAIAAVPENGAEATTITLLDNVTSADSLTFTNGQKAILNMNGKTVTFTSGKLRLQTATSLTLTGEGALVCQSSGTGAISIYGNETSQIDLLVDSGVTVDGHYGIALFGNNGATACRNVTVTVKGTVKTSEGGTALYVNGSVNDLEGPVPEITLAKGATVEAVSVGIYAAGYAKWTFAGDVTAGDDALSIKCGDITITGGTYMAKGEFNNPADANGNGTENTGAAVSITTNSAYAPKTNVTITGGTFISENGYAFYEGIAKKADGTPAATASRAVIALKGGDVTGSKTNEDVTADIAVTTAENKQVVSGGTFSQAVPEAFCAPGYAPKQNADGTYSVVVVGWYETGVDTNGDGVADAWTIRNEGDLAAFRDKVNSTVTFAGCTVKLTADLDLSDMGTWIPIGEGNAGGASKNGGFFAGTFEGNNHTIANVTASETKVSEGSGLFGWVRGATIRDLNVSGWFSNTNGAAGLIGVVDAQGAYTTTTITNVHNVGGTVQGTARGSNAGGIIGEIRSGVVTITGCSNAAAVTASINHSDTAGVLCAGGIVGDANGASVTISDCSNTGAVTAYPDDEGNAAQTPVFAGGIVGRMGTGSIAAGNGDNTGTVSATGAGTAGQGAILGGVVAGTQPVLTLALTEVDAKAGRVALFTAAEVVPEGLTVTVAPAEGASAPAGTVLAVDDGTLYCNLLYLANRVAGESEGETFNAAAQEALLAAAGNTLYGTIAVTGTTADDKALTTAQVNEVLACFEGEGLITASESEGVKTLVVAYDFGITGLRVTAEGDLVVTVAAQDAQAKPLAFAEGVTFALRNGEAALEAKSATVDGVTTLTVQAANLPAGNLELTISVAPAAEAETPAE